MSPLHNPFVGLRTFESNESLLFFGRQQQTLELLQHLHDHHFVAVVGSSGSGKSSLIRAGLIPSLKAGYLIDERDKWLLAIMKPGQSPVYNLAKSVVCEVNAGNSDEEVQQVVAAIQEEGADGLIKYLMPVINNNTNIFLLVDQFEELFRFSADNQNPEKKNEAIDFVNALLDISQRVNLPVYVVITMRSDFIGDCAQFYGLPETMNKSQYLVPRLSRMQLKNVITGPLSVNGASIEQTLLNQLLNDTGDNPDQLPVLQHALMRTWEVWKERNTTDAISVEDYKKTGTIRSALSQHAEEAYAELGDPRLQFVCEVVFKALTDKKLNARGVRRPQTFATLLQLTGATDPELRKVIDAFRTRGCTFLMPPATVELALHTVIDISHESLMRIWTRLIQWVEEESESEQIYIRLSEAALLYNQHRGGLWRNPELDIALQWNEKNKPNELWARQINKGFKEAMEFLELSRARNEQEMVDKEKDQKQRLRRARIIAATIGVIALISVYLMISAYKNAKKADDQARKAKESAAKAKQKEQLADSMKNVADKSMKYALKNESEALNAKDSALQQKERADSFSKVSKDALEKEKKSKQGLIAARNNILEQQKQLKLTNDSLRSTDSVSQANRNEAQKNEKRSDSLNALSRSLYDANMAIDELEQNHTQKSKNDVIEAYELNHKNNGPIQNSRIYEALNRYWTTLNNNGNQYTIHKAPVHCITVIPGSDLIITADEKGMIDVAVNHDGVLQHQSSATVNNNIRSMAVSPNGKRLVLISAEGEGYVYTISPGYLLTSPLLFTFPGIGKKIVFEDNNEVLIMSTKGISEFVISDTVAGKEIVSGLNYEAICISGKGTISTARRNEGIDIYRNSTDLANGHPLRIIPWSSNRDYITCIASEDNDQYIAAGTYHGNIKLFGSTADYPIYKIHQSSVNDLTFANASSGINQLCSAGSDQTLRLTTLSYLTGSGQSDLENITLYGHKKWVYGLAYNSKGTFIFSCGEDGKVIAWKPTMADLYNTINH